MNTAQFADRRQAWKMNVMDSSFATEEELEDLFLMANLFPKHTGLPFVIWISTCLGVPHDVLLKVARGENARPVEFITVGIRPKPHVINGSLSSEELQLLTNWIEVNREVIMQYWENKIDTVDALSRLRKV